MKIIRHICFLLILPLLIYGCKAIKNTTVLKQSHYQYHAENFGYSDIKKLYSSDSVNAKKPFFGSTSLQYLEMTIHSELKKTILKKENDRRLISYQLQNLKLDIKKEGISINSSKISKELTKPVFIETNTLGKVGVIKFDKELSEITKGIYKDIIGRIQYVKPLKKSNSWQTIEENTLGIYNAEYFTEKSSKSGDIYHKKIIDYRAYKSKKENQHIKADHSSTIETDAVGEIKKIDTSEAQIILHNKDTLSVLGSKVSIFKTIEEPVHNDEALNLSALAQTANYSQHTTLSKELSEKTIRHQAYVGTLGSDNWDSLIKKLSKPANSTKEEESTLVLKFRALFYVYPENCNKAISFLKKEQHDTLAFEILSNALTITESFHATDALADLVSFSKDDVKILDILLSTLTTTSYPTIKAINTVKSLAFNNNKHQDNFTIATAQLTLGGMAHKFRRFDTIQANQLTRYLVEKMKSHKDTIHYLKILENTRSSIVLPYVRSLIEHKGTSEHVKLEAITTLSSMNHTSVSVYLKKMLSNKNVAIKNKAVEVLNLLKKKNN